MNRHATLAAIILAIVPLAHVAAQDAPIPPKLAAGKMTLPEGFRATLFAGEPDVKQPIAFCFDDRGRLWVAENYSYPNWEADTKKGKDRVLIFEEGPDGAFSKRTVFADNLQNLSGINFGFGGIWLCSTPNLVFIPIKDDKPASPPEIVLDGWSLKAGHNVFNSLTWGPDGWLYGCNGIIATSRVGPPGTPDKDRVPMNCGVWRYHPTKKKFEAVAHGTTNPWGLDFDEHGEMFITNCVIDHLWHVVPGGHYLRMYGEDLNPNVYKLMPSICDHIHWGGGNWTTSRHPSTVGKHDDHDYKAHSEAGGGHAHVGCMIYLGDNWPDRYRGGAFMCNLHGNRINHDILERNGSTFVAHHGKDFMLANDPWFRGLALQYGPDGGVYVSDWCDTGECHNYKVVDQTNGRIFKITYGDVKPWKGDLAKLSDLELAKLQFSKNEWMVRHARLLLQERAQKQKIAPEVIRTLENYPSLNGRLMALRALWALHAVEALDLDNPTEFLKSSYEAKRVWALRLLLEDTEASAKTLEAVAEMARFEPSPLVRLHIAGSLPRLWKTRQLLKREWIEAILENLVLFHHDAGDPYLPLMYWYAAEPIISESGFPKYSASELPLLNEFAARRVTELMLGAKKDQQNRGFEALFKTMGHEPTFDRDSLRGVQTGLIGQRKARAPECWEKLYPVLIESPLAEVRERAVALAVQFGDQRAFALLRKIVSDRGQPEKQREDALKTLLFQQKADLVPILHELLQDDAMRSPAIRGLAAFDDPQTPAALLQGYPKWNAEARGDVIQTLSSRSKFALALLDALEKQAIPRADVNSYTIRQLQALKSPEVSAKLTKLWGEIRPASAEKAKLMAKYKAELKPDTLKKANLANGRTLFVKSCATCHRMFGEGSDIGPDLTGSQRTNLDYILENVLDPSAIVPREYQVTVVVTTAGRTLSGIVKKESDAALTLQTQNELVVVPKGDVESRTQTKVSMMPEGIFEQLRIEEVRDLVGYLASSVQVPVLGQSKK